MPGFVEITFDEQEEYLKTSEYMNTDKRKQLIGELSIIESKMEKYCIELEKIKELVEQNEVEELYAKCAYLTRRIAGTVKALGIIPAEYGIKNKQEYIRSVVVEKKDVRFYRVNNKLKIILPELLPHRPQYDVISGKMKYMYDIDQWRAGYYSAFSEEFMRGKYRVFGEKVCIVFMHHVRPENQTDIDNLEYKVITDIITLFLLIDDSRLYMSRYADMIEDEKNYTEIIICPQNELGEYVIA